MLSALNVAYRDFRYVIPFMVQVWMFATPTIYMQPGEAPGGFGQFLMSLNPMTSLIAAFRAATLGGPISWSWLGITSVWVIVIFVAGCFYFRRVEDSFADVI